MWKEKKKNETTRRLAKSRHNIDTLEQNESTRKYTDGFVAFFVSKVFDKKQNLSLFFFKLVVA